MKSKKQRRPRLELVEDLAQTDARANVAAGAIVEARIERVIDGQTAIAVLSGGDRVEVRLPRHADAPWLAAAANLAPVEAVLVWPAPGAGAPPRPVLWGVFPGPEHEGVVVDVEIRARALRLSADSVRVATERAHVQLDEEGRVEVRGRDILSRASGVMWIKGGAVRLN